MPSVKGETESNHLADVLGRLRRAFGPQGWWPVTHAGSAEAARVEIVVGAILTQNTAWTNVERAIARMQADGLLSWAALRDVPEAALAEAIRSSGTYRVKARRIKSFVGRLWTDYGGRLEELLAGEVADCRRRLLAIDGIGPETADAILLYAGGRPSFVVDAYTQRVLRRHFLVEPDAAYDAVQARFHKAMDGQASTYNEFHALLVELGKRHCRTQAQCRGCPLEDMPHDAEL